MLTSHRTRYRTRHIGVSALLTLGLAAGLAAGLAILALSGDRTEATGPPPSYNLYNAVSGEGAIILNPPGGVYSSGTTVTVTADPEDGWESITGAVI